MPDANTKDLCDTCVVLMRRAFTVKEVRRKQMFTCAQCGKKGCIGSVCELTAKRATKGTG
jgi:hypothetical protein